MLNKLWRFIMHKTPSGEGQLSESLDYEPVQNDLYFGRVKARRGGTRRMYGCVHFHILCSLLCAVSPFPVRTCPSAACHDMCSSN